MAPTSTLPDWLSRSLDALKSGDVDGYLEMYAPDAVHEFPFAPEGAPRRLEGRAAIADYMRGLPGLLRFGPFTDIRVRQAEDETIVEFTGHHHSIPDDAPRDIDYVFIITRRDGEVTHIRDYMNPLQLVAA
ncbi:nuclear transport factor 2 family protein [Sciscionella sediminilitoris]|uniref:nuclear transport factor 2 family protein n=1 Tax=Sciscionella sediminilitoris TaxID=1445613 RepID=UPI0004DF7171|nr:nuclear transport factor 2 family protein [Sciscionella sp. SE31]